MQSKRLWTRSIDLVLLAELCVLRTFGSPQIPLVFICPQSVPAFPWDRLGASIEFPVIPKRAQYAQFGCQYRYGTYYEWYGTCQYRYGSATVPAVVPVPTTLFPSGRTTTSSTYVRAMTVEECHYFLTLRNGPCEQNSVFRWN